MEECSSARDTGGDIVYLDLYTVYESLYEAEITYAPIELLISLDSWKIACSLSAVMNLDVYR